MSRKQLTVERIRKKKAAASATPTVSTNNSNNNSSNHNTIEHRRRDGVDPFHNGQTPTCRLLLDAVQDIFPELQQQMKERTVSSELGQLLRWQVLKRRKERLFPPPPPLSSASPPERKEILLDEMNDDGNEPAASSNKKKRKKKKKKKDAGGDGPNEPSLTAAPSEDSDKGNDATMGDRKENSQEQPCTQAVSSRENMNGFGHDVTTTKGMVDRSTPPTTTTTTTNGPPTLQIMDQSVHQFQEQSLILQQIVTPDLQALPADDLHTMEQEEGHSSMAFLAQIHQESTEREDDDENSVDFELPLAPAPLPETPQGHGTRPRTRARTLSSSSFASFEGVVTPTTKNTGNDDDDDENGSDEHMAYMTSPVTHEWVPEEGSEAKTETPPGDVIKNPLEMPFLRTLCKVNGLTTTTIDGSLISAAWPENSFADSTARLSSIETTKILMEDWMGQLLEQNKAARDELCTITGGMEKDYNSFLGYLQTKLRNGNQASGIPFSDLKNAVNEIDCSTCQKDALDVVKKWSGRDENQPIVLNPVVLQDQWLHDTSDFDTAFDYVALEEGHHLPKPEPPDEEDGEGVDKALHLSLYIAEPPLKKVGNKYLFIDQMTPKHLTSLVENWLPCGIVEDILVETSVSSSGLGSNNEHGEGTVSVHDHVTKLQSLVLERQKIATNLLEEMDDLGKRILEDLGEIRSTLDPSRPNIEIVAYPKMKQVDERCTDLCDKILEVVLLITGGHNDALESLKLKVWGKYLETLGKTLQACETFYRKVGEGMADQTGALPVPFVSAAFRSVFQELIEAKVHIWTEFGTFLFNHLTGRVLRELYTRSVWYLENSAATNEQQLMTPLDEACCNLVKDLASWTATLRRGRMSEIQRERMGQTERMLEQLQAVVEPMATEYATVERFFSAERNIYFASLRSHIVLAQGVKKKMRLVDSAEVEGMTTGFLLVWAHTRLMQNRMINSSKIPPLPLQLKRWMLQDENSLTQWNGFDDSSPLNSYHQRYCQGRQGKRRVMCIVAGLVYRWLEEQCKSWRAELAEKELLIDFEDSNKPVPAGQSKEVPASSKIAKSKKSKKKKVKNTATSSNDDDSSRLGDSTSVIAHNNSSAHLNGRATPPPYEGSDDEKPSDYPTTPSTTLPDHGLSSDVLYETIMPALQDDQSIPLEDQPDAPEFDDSHLDDASIPRIFVEDGNNIISPDAFLVARMREMMVQSITSDNIILIG